MIDENNISIMLSNPHHMANMAGELGVVILRNIRKDGKTKIFKHYYPPLKKSMEEIDKYFSQKQKTEVTLRYAITIKKFGQCFKKLEEIAQNIEAQEPKDIAFNLSMACATVQEMKYLRKYAEENE